MLCPRKGGRGAALERRPGQEEGYAAWASPGACQMPLCQGPAGQGWLQYPWGL